MTTEQLKRLRVLAASPHLGGDLRALLAAYDTLEATCDSVSEIGIADTHQGCMHRLAAVMEVSKKALRDAHSAASEIPPLRFRRWDPNVI